MKTKPAKSNCCPLGPMKPLDKRVRRSPTQQFLRSDKKGGKKLNDKKINFKYRSF